MIWFVLFFLPFLLKVRSADSLEQADTCGTLALASKHLKEAGAKSVIALVTHGILSGPAFDKINSSDLERIVVTNTIPQSANLTKSDRLKCVDVSHVLAETIRRSHYGESISYLFVALLLCCRLNSY